MQKDWVGLRHKIVCVVVENPQTSSRSLEMDSGEKLL